MKIVKMNMTTFRMKLVKLTLATVWVMAALSSHADRQSVNQQLHAVADGVVHINVVRGDIQVEGWSKDLVDVSGLLDAKVEEFIFDVDGDETRISVKIPRNIHSRWGHSEATDLVIRVPEKSKVKMAGVSTDIDIDNVEAGVEVGVVSGDINLNGGVGRIILQTVSGEVEIRNASGRIRVKTVSGDIDSYNTSGNSSYGSISGEILVEEGGEELELETVSGEIEVVRTDFERITGHSVSGDVDIRGSMRKGGFVDFDNVSGSIRLDLGGDVNAKFDLETSSGSIRNRITSDKPKASKYVRDERLRFVAGNGDGEVILSTRSGNITVSN